jgi:hypothetical protein
MDSASGSVSAASAAPAQDDVKLSLPQKAKALAKALPPAYWQALTVVGLLYFARFDASFITLRAKTVSPLPHLSASIPPLSLPSTFYTAINKHVCCCVAKICSSGTALYVRCNHNLHKFCKIVHNSQRFVFPRFLALIAISSTILLFESPILPSSLGRPFFHPSAFMMRYHCTLNKLLFTVLRIGISSELMDT